VGDFASLVVFGIGPIGHIGPILLTTRPLTSCGPSTEVRFQSKVHHEKLWFAGINQNWKLADFEINEIKESLEDIQTYCTDRPERKSLTMIDRPLDSISYAIQQKDEALFKKSFITLTNTCNNCHRTTEHEFNVIKIPDTPPFSNQEFKP